MLYRIPLLLLLWILFTSCESNESGFTIVVFPDTQYYSAYYPINHFFQSQWVCDCKEELNIRFVAHLGDLVEHDNLYSYEWRIVSAIYDTILKCNIPMSVLPGNHDQEIRGENSVVNSKKMYNEHFNIDFFSKNKHYNGSFSQIDYSNTYYYLKMNNQTELLIISLEYLVTASNQEGILNWTRELISSNQDKKVIIVTHFVSDGCRQNVYGFLLTLVNDFCNIILITGGHVVDCIENKYVINNKCNRPTFIIVTNYQSLQQGGLSWLRYYTFYQIDEKELLICSNTYSPQLIQYKKDSSAYFSMLTNDSMFLEGCTPEKVCSSHWISPSHTIFNYTLMLACFLYLYSRISL